MRLFVYWPDFSVPPPYAMMVSGLREAMRASG